MMAELARAWPDNAVMVDDAISSRGALYSAIKFDKYGDLEGEFGAAIGWGMGAALGVQQYAGGRAHAAMIRD